MFMCVYIYIYICVCNAKPAYSTMASPECPRSSWCRLAPPLALSTMASAIGSCCCEVAVTLDSVDPFRARPS